MGIWLPLSCSSQMINEIAWMGTALPGIEPKNFSQYEWIELYNENDSPVNISGYTIENAGKSNRPITLQGIIGAQGYFVVCRKKLDFCDQVDSGLSLNDGYGANGQLVLKDEEGEVLDQTPAGDSWPAGDKETRQTMARRKANWKTVSPTPKAENNTFLEIPKAFPQNTRFPKTNFFPFFLCFANSFFCSFVFLFKRK